MSSKHIKKSLLYLFLCLLFLFTASSLNSLQPVTAGQDSDNYQKPPENKLPENRTALEEEIDSLNAALIAREAEIRKLKEKNHNRSILFVSLTLVFILVILLILYLRFREKTGTSRELRSAYIQMEKLAKLDPLTQLYNRNSMEYRIDIEMIKMGRTWRPFCLVMIHIDDFRRINDESGHDCGDKILESFGLILVKNLRKQDAASRWGDEEFLLMLPETSLDGGFIIGERIRKKVEDSIITYGDMTLKFTITLGVAVRDRLTPVSRTITNASAALYEGIKRGKNTIIRSDDPELKRPVNDPDHG